MAQSDLVDRLQELLKKAKAGEITGLHYYVNRPSGASWGFANMSHSDIAAAAIATHKNALEALEDVTTDPNEK